MSLSKDTFRSPPSVPRWLWSYLAAGAALGAIVLAGGNFGEALAAALAFATFTATAGLAQMLVMTVGEGSVDLSIPSAMTLCAVCALKVMDANDGAIALGGVVAIAVGAGVGLFNSFLVRELRIPPIIATLGSSLIFTSIATALGQAVKSVPPPALLEVVHMRLLGVPSVAFVAAALMVLIGLALDITPIGRAICATGQNARAARLAGLDPAQARLVVYVASGILAGVAGTLVAAYSGGASLDLASGYLLLSIAIVVVGGTGVAGGRPSVGGLPGAALFMFLLVSLLNSFDIGAGYRTLITGLVIILVVSLAKGKATS